MCHRDGERMHGTSTACPIHGRVPWSCRDHTDKPLSGMLLHTPWTPTTGEPAPPDRAHGGPGLCCLPPAPSLALACMCHACTAAPCPYICPIWAWWEGLPAPAAAPVSAIARARPPPHLHPRWAAVELPLRLPLAIEAQPWPSQALDRVSPLRGGHARRVLPT